MGKRGEELRALIKKFPPPGDVKAILDGLDKESDRGAALVGTALLDAALEKVLIRRMKNDSKELRSQLFQNRGPLADFHSKIVIALAFDAINTMMEFELQILRSIRNAFAHATTSLTFETPEVAREIKRSQIIKVMAEVDAKSEQKLRQVPPKSEFILLVRLMFLFLDSHHQHFGGTPLQSK